MILVGIESCFSPLISGATQHNRSCSTQEHSNKDAVSLKSAIEDIKLAFKRFSFTYQFCGTEWVLKLALIWIFCLRNTQKI